MSTTEADFAKLEAESWIDAPTAEQWGLYRVSSSEGAALVGRSDRADYSGIVFPVYWPGDPSPKERFLRRDHPDLESGSNGTLKARGKYLAPPGRGNRLLFGPRETAEALTDAAAPIVLVEGLKKTLAAWRLSRWESAEPRFLSCGLTGVWNFRGTIGKAFDASGARVSVKGTIPDLDRVTWDGRSVLIVYDSDSATNPSVRAAREALAEELRGRGARVVMLFLPALDGLEKTGFDDLCARWGPQAVLDWLRQAEAGAAEVEDDPEPIPLDAFNLPTLPLVELPDCPLRAMVQAVSAFTETPPELALLAGLGVVATAIQRTYAVEPEPGYTEPTNLFAIAALESGNRKTSVLREMTEPLFAFEREYARANEAAVAQAEAERRLAEDRVKALRARAARSQGVDFDVLREELLAAEAAIPTVRPLLRLTAQDVTPERLGQLMAEHGEKMAIISDEGGIFDVLAGRYSNNVPNLDLFLQAHSGAVHRVDRGSRPAIFLDRPALTLVLSPQPSVLQGLASTPSFRGRGLLARPLYALPKSVLGFRTLQSEPIPVSIRQAYRQSIERLLRLPPNADETPILLRFSGAALPAWKEFQRHVETELRDGGAFQNIRDWASKLPGNLARVAALLHCAEEREAPPEQLRISSDTMEAALTLGAIFERHALAVFSLMAVDPRLDAAQKVWSWIERTKSTEFTKRDCFKGVQSAAFPDVASVEGALLTLLERGFIFPLPQERRGGRPSQGFRVNRKILEART